MRIFKKFMSKNFLLTLISGIFSLCAALSGLGGEVGTVCSFICAFASPVIYVIAEGVIDAKALSLVSESVSDASEILSGLDKDKKENDGEDNNENIGKGDDIIA